MFPWSFSRQGQPNDLPDIFTEDIFMLMPVNSQQIYAGWNISYEHQNLAAGLWGEERFSSSRLAVKLIFMPNTDNFCIYDVSGPGQSIYLQLPEYHKKMPAHINFIGLLGYCGKDLTFLPIISSSAVFMSTGRVRASQEAVLPRLEGRLRHSNRDNLPLNYFDNETVPHNPVQAVMPFYTRLKNTQSCESITEDNPYLNLEQLTNALDKQMGRSSVNGEK
ncbi:hypothetical protein IJT93_02080 [bacterium]|nr:hypothetical protein [bacterium]